MGEIIFRAAGIFIGIGRSRSGFTNPACVSLGRDDVTKVLQGVKYRHCTVLDAVFVAGDDTAANPAIVDGLVLVVQLSRFAIEPLDNPSANGALR